MTSLKKAIEDLRGQITIHSKFGQGTRFEIRLPLVDEDSKQASQMSA
jgi:signal transduction histidine kinase